MGATSRSVDQVVLAATPLEVAEGAASFHGLSGRSLAMRQTIRQMQQIAPNLALAMVEGEEGTGRTLAARALHCAGPAAAGPFVPCLATHFFPASDGSGGHGWSSELLVQADRGMLFLDRVHQLDARQQELLVEFLHYWENLRAIEAGDWEGRGSSSSAPSPRPAQIVVSASVDLHRPCQSMGASMGVKWGGRDFPAFREDLASRLGAVRFRLPPLRERREDIPLLAQIFIQRFAFTYGKPVRGLGPGTIAPLLRHVWSGNVRELEEAIVAACVRTESQWLRPIDLPPLASESRSHAASEIGADDDSEVLNLDEVIRCHVAGVLERMRGNKLKAAQVLGISRSTLYRILEHGSRSASAAS